MPITPAVGYDVDKKPAAWTSAQAARRERFLWIGLALGFVVVGMYFVLTLTHRLGIGAAFALAATVLLIRPHANRYFDSVARWFRGARAEEAVGDMPNELRRDDWIVMHDVEQAYEQNIDHIAAGPAGVFMIETKLRGYQDRQLVKARRQAAKLHDEIGVWVTPVICLHDRNGKPFRHDRVSIVPSQHLLAWLREQHGKPVEFERLARFADRIS
jgi:hypothetical protein